jgi:hypothetical protein
MTNIFGYALRGIFGSVSPGWTAALPTREQLQYMQDVYSLANELRITPAQASAMIASRKLAPSGS